MMPEGSLQLVCASHPMNSTGCSAASGARTASPSPARPPRAAALRTHPAVTERAARLNIEADSLNAAVLAPAAVPGTAEFDLFCAEVVKEMTTKAGQKCTAIRRALVPERAPGRGGGGALRGPERV